MWINMSLIQRNSTNIEDLPVELIDTIVGILDSKDLARLSGVSKRFYGYVHNSTTWRHRVFELWQEEGYRYGNMLEKAFSNKVHSRDPTNEVCICWKHIYSALEGLTTSTCIDDHWDLDFVERDCGSNFNKAPHYWAQIITRRRVSPGKYNVIWNLSVTKEFIGKVNFSCTLEEDNSGHQDHTRCANLVYGRFRTSIDGDILNNTMSGKYYNTSELVPLENIGCRSSKLNRVRRPDPNKSTTLLSRYLHSDIVSKLYERFESNGSTTGAEVTRNIMMGQIDIPNSGLKGREWQSISMAIEFQRGLSPNFHLKHILLEPVLDDSDDAYSCMSEPIILSDSDLRTNFDKTLCTFSSRLPPSLACCRASLDGESNTSFNDIFYIVRSITAAPDPCM
ncbi:hypothetical protein V1511DRAFT_311344 [Dipodascopsis uninucleata]